MQRPRTRMLGLALAFALAPAVSSAQESYKVEASKDAPPEALAPAIREALRPEGFRVLDPKGKPFAEFWLRKEVPASGKPAGMQGAVQFPVLAEGELLGAIKYAVEGGDYRDQSIAAGVYTLRYGLQPVNGDHLGVSPFRDYALLLPAAKDKAVALLPRKELEEESAEAAGTNHPAILFLLTAPAGAKGEPSIVHNEEKKTWGAIAPLDLAVKGEAAPVPLPVQLIVVGATQGG
jgi:hypothetical protein